MRARLRRGIEPNAKLLHDAIRAIRSAGFNLENIAVYEDPPSVLLTLALPPTASDKTGLWHRLARLITRPAEERAIPVYFLLAYAALPKNECAAELTILRRRTAKNISGHPCLDAERDLHTRLFAAIARVLPLA